MWKGSIWYAAYDPEKHGKINAPERIEATPVELCEAMGVEHRGAVAGHFADRLTPERALLLYPKRRPIRKGGGNGEPLQLRGRRFGYLTAVEPSSERGPLGHVLWRCVCACGGERLVETRKLTSGQVRSCGHLQTKRSA